MARPASGVECIEAARKLFKSARTAEELRMAQAVLLPLEMGLSLEETARIIGRSKGATCNMRIRFVQISAGQRPASRSKRTLRNRAKADLERERQILDETLHESATGGVVVVFQLKPVVEAKLGKTMALSTLYRMLARHGWRKLALNTQHPQGDPQAREAWKKIPRRAGTNRSGLSHTAPIATDVPGRSAIRTDQSEAILLGKEAHAALGQSHADPPICLRLWCV